MILSVFKRIGFALEHKTLRPVTISRKDPGKILIFHRGGTTELPRRCPHQGAPMETGYLKGDDWLCPWHGCKFPLKCRE